MNFQHDILLKVRAAHSKREMWTNPCEQSGCHQLTKWGGLADVRRPDGLKLVNLDITVTPTNEQLNQFWHWAVIMPCHWKVYNNNKTHQNKVKQSMKFHDPFLLLVLGVVSYVGQTGWKLKEVYWIINDQVFFFFYAPRSLKDWTAKKCEKQDVSFSICLTYGPKIP